MILYRHIRKAEGQCLGRTFGHWANLLSRIVIFAVYLAFVYAYKDKRQTCMPSWVVEITVTTLHSTHY